MTGVQTCALPIWASQHCHPTPFQGFLALFGQKTPKRTGMTSLGFLGLSSQSVSRFFAPFRPEPRNRPFWVFVGPFRPENPKTDWEDKPGLPRVVIPVRFGFFGRVPVLRQSRNSPQAPCTHGIVSAWVVHECISECVHIATK